MQSAQSEEDRNEQLTKILGKLQISKDYELTPSMIGKLPKRLPFQKLARKVNVPIDSLDPSSVSEDRARFICNLRTWGMAETPVKGDGNCQFRSISHQFWNSEDYHLHVSRRADAASAFIFKS